MNVFFQKLFSRKEDKVQNLIDTIKRISIISDEVAKKKSKLDELEYDLMVNNKDEMFISLADFMELINKPNLTIKDIMVSCKHVSELSKLPISFINVHSIVENDHVVLCPDAKECELHKDYEGSKIKITMVKQS